jgi:hypothetical protein
MEYWTAGLKEVQAAARKRLDEEAKQEGRPSSQAAEIHIEPPHIKADRR